MEKRDRGQVALAPLAAVGMEKAQRLRMFELDGALGIILPRAVQGGQGLA